jgi:predicted glycogen debranching enzyme
MIFLSNEDKIMIKYTLVDAHSPTTLKFKPFLAFRNVHFLTKANTEADTMAHKIPNGIRVKMYHGYTPLFMQFSKSVEYTHVPDWYYNVEYQKEIDRGYESTEDLFVPGYFEVPIKKGESIYFVAGITETQPTDLKKLFQNESKRRLPRDTYKNCLLNAAQQFIVNRDGKTMIVAGYPYFGRFSRDTFVSLPGLTLVKGDAKLCKEVIDTMLHELNGALFPNIITHKSPEYNTVDASLWFIWALQQYANFTGSNSKLWKEYGTPIKQILNGYREGTSYNIHMLDNGLIYAGSFGKALTWMDAIIDGVPITPRTGCDVEVNALWYNALMFAIELAELDGDKIFVEEWKTVADLAGKSFVGQFWDQNHGYLADSIDGDKKDWTIRPNQVIATSMQYTPLKEEQRKSVLSVIKRELLTNRGLRTLSPQDMNYHGNYFGNPVERDQAYHQGTIFPWLFGHFTEGYLKIHGRGGLSLIKGIFKDFEKEMIEHGLGTISEVYDGDPPHKPGGSISQAWSVAELLRVADFIEKMESK